VLNTRSRADLMAWLALPKPRRLELLAAPVAVSAARIPSGA
jgi:hypothetical protein